MQRRRQDGADGGRGLQRANRDGGDAAESAGGHLPSKLAEQLLLHHHTQRHGRRAGHGPDNRVAGHLFRYRLQRRRFDRQYDDDDRRRNHHDDGRAHNDDDDRCLERCDGQPDEQQLRGLLGQDIVNLTNSSVHHRPHGDDQRGGDLGPLLQQPVQLAPGWSGYADQWQRRGYVTSTYTLNSGQTIPAHYSNGEVAIQWQASAPPGSRPETRGR